MLSIPEGHARFFQTLIEAAPETLAELPGRLAEGKLGWSVTDFGQQFVEDSELDEELIRAATVVSASLLTTTESSTLTGDTLLEAVARGAAARIELEEGSEEWNRLMGFMRAIVAAPGNLGLSRKVGIVSGDREHLYIDARILTDVRPVFSLDGLEISTSVIVHSLGVTTHDTDGEHRTVYVSMDRADLLQLREMVARALKKDTIVREQLGVVGWSVVESGLGESADDA